MEKNSVEVEDYSANTEMSSAQAETYSADTEKLNY